MKKKLFGGLYLLVAFGALYVLSQPSQGPYPAKGGGSSGGGGLAASTNAAGNVIAIGHQIDGTNVTLNSPANAGVVSPTSTVTASNVNATLGASQFGTITNASETTTNLVVWPNNNFAITSHGGMLSTNDSTGNWMQYTNGVETVSISNAANTPLISLDLTNNQPASAGNQMYSPFMRFRGFGWKTTATAASQPVDFTIGVVTVQGSTSPSGWLYFSNSINGATPTLVVGYDNNGNILLPHFSGIGGGNFLISDTSATTTPFLKFVTSGGGQWFEGIEQSAGANINGSAKNDAFIRGTSALWFSATANPKAEINMNTGDIISWGSLVTSNGVASYASNQLAITTISVGSSPFSWTNTLTKNVNVFVDGAGVSAASAINGTTVYTAVTGGDYNLPLQPGEWCTITYTIGAPGMKWKPF